MLAQIISATINMMVEGNVEIPTRYMVVVAIAIHLLWALKNKMNMKNQGLIAVIICVFIVVINLAVSLCLVIFSDKVSSIEFIFLRFNNQTGFDESYDVYVMFMGLLFS